MVAKLQEKGLLEKALIKEGHTIVGIDEVGRGCLAGPIYACSVILDYEKLDLLDDKSKSLIRDSKKLSAKQRAEIIPTIKSVSIDFNISSSSVREIEMLGIVQANFRAMRRSLRQLSIEPTIILIDGNIQIPRCRIQQKAIVGGDNYCYSIAAASILAKEARDSFMVKKSKLYPGYDFESNVGYGTKNHLEGLNSIGICPIHRKNFAPISKLIEAKT